jgi:hypothetical protein
MKLGRGSSNPFEPLQTEEDEEEEQEDDTTMNYGETEVDPLSASLNLAKQAPESGAHTCCVAQNNIWRALVSL